MGPIVYILCSILSLACFVFLYRGYQRSNFRLLFWSSMGFVGFFLNNILLLVDSLTGATIDLSVIRTVPALAGMTVLIYGLITEST